MIPAAEAADLSSCFGLGVAGNFAGHLEQAGEAGDFSGVDAAAEAPKGLFPWFVPHEPGFLGEFPISDCELVIPGSDQPLNLQIEPEAGVVCSVEYAAGAVRRLTPTFVAAFNDCSIRRDGAAKISEKKNWGACSKGFAARGFAVNELDRDGATAQLRIASYLRRGGEVFEYGIDSAVAHYSYYGATLLDWIVDRLNNQTGEGPLEDVGAQLVACGSPDHVLIGIGATRYTEFGESNFLEAGDESVVVVYDGSAHTAAEVAAAVGSGSELSAASVLTQLVTRSPGDAERPT